MNSLNPLETAKNLLVAILLVVFLGIAALAIDVYHLLVVRNELQNAADAAALAGAKVLYYDYYDDPDDPYDDDKPDTDPDNDPPSADLAFTINPGANMVAYNTALQNISEKIAVEVNDPTSNSGDVQRGHWSFSAEKFQADSYTTPVQIASYTTAELDDPTRNGPSGDIRFINAVKVVVRRQDKPAASFFAQFFGFENFGLMAEATAYIGFAGSLPPGAIDEPIAICEDYIRDINGNYSCNIGRMISEDEETGGWTNFDQNEGCGNVGTGENGIGGLLCSGGNRTDLMFGLKMGTTNGMTDLLSQFYDDCWTDGSQNPPTTSMNVTLPVVGCENGNFEASCVEKLIGAVNLDIIWINTQNASEDFKNVGKNKENPPTHMEAPGHAVFECNYTDTPSAEHCWDLFVSHFNLKDKDGQAAPYKTKTIYFLPNCEFHKPTGITGGENFGILAKIPVLVN